MVKRIPRFEKGQKVAIVNFSGTIRPDGLKNFLDYNRELGIDVVIPQSIKQIKDKDFFGNYNYIQALEEFYEFLIDDSVGLIMCASGGFGAQRIAQNLDYDLFSMYPKLVSGLSDITVVVNAIYSKTKYPAILGITAEIFDEEHKLMYNDLLTIAMRLDDTIVYKPEKYFVRYVNNVRSLGFSSIGVGGNLTMIETMIGTDYINENTFDSKIIFLEDVHETSYDTHRRLIHLDHAHVFDKVKAVVIGYFESVESMHSGSSMSDDNFPSPSLTEILVEFFKDKNFPVVYGFPFSHCKGYNITIPIGGEFELIEKNDEIHLVLYNNIVE